jgi:hypothetical protein
MHCSRVDAFRHRADPIMVDRPAQGHAELGLTLTGGRDQQKWKSGFASDRAPNDEGRGQRPYYWGENACRATNVIRHGLCPILKCAREAVNPLAVSFSIMSASL